jgi:hypothetical protein
MNTIIVATLLLSNPNVFVVEKVEEPKVCMIYKDHKFTCTELMLIYNKHEYKDTDKGI